MTATMTSKLPTMEEIITSGTCYEEISPASPGVVPCYEKWDESIGETFSLGRDPHWARTAAAKLEAAEAIKVAKVPKVKAVKAPVVPKEPKVNDKKVTALRICDANSELGLGALGRLIAKELEITVANGYYYASRVWKKR